MSGVRPAQDESRTLARVRRSADRYLSRSLHSAVSRRRAVGVLRYLWRSQHVGWPAPHIGAGPHRWQPTEQSARKPAADLSELRLTAPDVQEPESRQRALLPPAEIRKRPDVLTAFTSRRRPDLGIDGAPAPRDPRSDGPACPGPRAGPRSSGSRPSAWLEGYWFAPCASGSPVPDAAKHGRPQLEVLAREAVSPPSAAQPRQGSLPGQR